MKELDEIKDNFLKQLERFYENLIREGCEDEQINLPVNYFRVRGGWKSHLDATFQSVRDILNDCPDLNIINLIDYAIDDMNMIVSEENVNLK